MTDHMSITPPVLLVLQAMIPARSGISADQIALTTGMDKALINPILVGLEQTGWVIGEWVEGDRVWTRSHMMSEDGLFAAIARVRKMASADPVVCG